METFAAVILGVFMLTRHVSWTAIKDRQTLKEARSAKLVGRRHDLIGFFPIGVDLMVVLAFCVLFYWIRRLNDTQKLKKL